MKTYRNSKISFVAENVKEGEMTKHVHIKRSNREAQTVNRAIPYEPQTLQLTIHFQKAKILTTCYNPMTILDQLTPRTD